MTSLRLLPRLVAAAGVLASVSCSSRDPAPVETSPVETSPVDHAEALLSSLRAHALGVVREGGRFVPRVAGHVRAVGAVRAELPARAVEPTRIAAASTPGAWIDVRALDVAPNAAQIDGAGLRFPSIAPATDAVLLAFPTRVEELRVLRDRSAPTTFRWAVALGPGLESARLVGAPESEVVRLRGKDGRDRLTSEPMWAEDARGVRRTLSIALEREGAEWILTASLDTTGLAFPVVVDPGWTTVASAMSPQARAPGVQASYGGALGVVLAGGVGPGGATTGATQFYDTSADAWTALGSMGVPRRGHLLVSSGGDPIAIGGEVAGGGPSTAVERLTMATGTWSALAPMPVARRSPKGAAVGSGRFLVVGGGVEGADLYTVAGDVWVKPRQPSAQRDAFDAIALESGKVLAVSPSATEIYDATSDTWTVHPPPALREQRGSLARLTDGTIVLVGGFEKGTSAPAKTIERFDPTTGTWSAVGALLYPSVDHAAFSDGVGAILLGGHAAERWKAGTDATVVGGLMLTPRTESTRVALGSGKYLVAGGLAEITGTTLAHSEIFDATQLGSGQPCTDDIECSSGFCADGVCCSSRCAGGCVRCDAAGSVGTCQAVSGADPRAICPSTGCWDGCSGGTCLQRAVGATCGAPTCSAGYLLTSTCDVAAACLASATPCPSGFGCTDDLSACRTSCTTAAHCRVGSCDVSSGTCTTGASDAGSDATVDASGDGSTDASAGDGSTSDSSTGDALPQGDAVAPQPETGTPTAPPLTVLRCSDDAECTTGFCVEGVCCDSRCTDRCHSCALPTSPGKCTVEPAGVDLRNECGPPLDCIGTCDGAGQCIGATTGTLCARSKCVGPSRGVGPAYCIASGVRCPAGEAIPFQCAPYACDGVFGACFTQCTSSDQCAAGFVCDLGARACVESTTAAADEEGCGCRVAGGDRASGAPWVASLVALAIVGLRRRARVGAALGVALFVAALAGCEPRPRDEARSTDTLRALAAIPGLVPHLPGPGRLIESGGVLRLEGGPQQLRPASAGLVTQLGPEPGAPARLSPRGHVDAWIEVRTVDVPFARRGVVDGAALVYEGVADGTDLVYVVAPTSFEELRLLRGPTSKQTLRWTVRVGAAVADVRVSGRRVEVIDDAGRVVLRTDPIVAIDRRGHERAFEVEVRPEAPRTFTVEAHAELAGLEAPIAIDPAWRPLAAGIPFHAAGGATLVKDGSGALKGFFVGGVDGAGAVVKSVDEYDPVADVWISKAALPAPLARLGIATTPGKIYAFGGDDGVLPSSDAYAYDVALNAWTTHTNMAVKRSAPGVVVLGDGRILVAGGREGLGVHQDAQVFDPAGGSWTAPSVMATPRADFALALLPSGKVLAVGGTATSGTTSVEVWDPSTSTSTWTAATPTPFPVRTARAVSAGGAVYVASLLDGRVLRYREGTSAWTELPPAIGGQASFLGLLSDGRLFVGGGTGLEASLIDPTAATVRGAGSTMIAAGEPGLVFPGAPSDSVVLTTAGEPRAVRWDGLLPNGAACTTQGDCASGHCTDGVCCTTAACASGESCGSSVGAGTCRKLAGVACASDAECGTGFCRDGVCCLTACAGGCKQCNVAPNLGKCFDAIDEAPDPRGICPSGACSVCRGGACAVASAGRPCGTSCAGDQITFGTCTGTSPSCGPTATTPCPAGLTCQDATSCKTSCLTGADCTSGICVAGACVVDPGAPDAGAPDAETDAETDAADASTDATIGDGTFDDGATDSSPAEAATDGSAPDAPTDVTAPKPSGTPSLRSDVQTCARNDECPTGHCVDGVCCDTACTDRCHSCALVDSPGKCTLAPAGVDLRGECGPLETCLGTCNGSGQCVGAGPGTQCGRNRCVGRSKGLGPAFCAAAGATCPTGEAVEFDCAPYACEPAFGACRTTCTSSDECAPGFVCDPASRQCQTAPAAAIDEGGCGCRVVGGGGRDATVAAIAIAVAGSVARRRRTARRSRFDARG